MSETAEPLGEGLYVYAVVPATVSRSDLGTGINGAQLELIATEADIAAVVHRHRTVPFQGADADVKRWVSEHGEVVEKSWEQAGTVLPMSFNVIVAADDHTSAAERLTQWLSESAGPLKERLEALQGRAELRIEIYLDQHVASAENSEVIKLREEMRQRPAGIQRLLQKRLDAMERRIADQLADGLYPRYRHRIARLSEDLAENRRTHLAEGFVPVLTVAVLVSHDRISEIGAELTAIKDEQPGASIRFLGPWPPYSFADVPALAAPDNGAIRQP
jgi:hypothetical protein